VLSDAEFAQLTETATCKQCYAGYKLRSTNRDETEKGLCLHPGGIDIYIA
jgi:hypothetical protein